jgi:hypothetical protein
MATVQEVESLSELRSLLETSRKEIGLNSSVGQLTCQPYSYDVRIQWETWIICENGAAISRRQFPKGPFQPISRSSRDRY